MPSQLTKGVMSIDFNDFSRSPIMQFDPQICIGANAIVRDHAAYVDWVWIRAQTSLLK